MIRKYVVYNKDENSYLSIFSGYTKKLEDAKILTKKEAIYRANASIITTLTVKDINCIR